jgi:hypothetical protein
MTENDNPFSIPSEEERAAFNAEHTRYLDSLGPPPLPTEEERAALCGLTLEAFRALKHPFQIENDRLRAERLAREADAAAAPMTKLRALAAAGVVNASHMFTQYKRSAQLSALIAAVSDETGAVFSSKREHDLIDGSVVGVRVTYKGQK